LLSFEFGCFDIGFISCVSFFNFYRTESLAIVTATMFGAEAAKSILDNKSIVCIVRSGGRKKGKRRSVNLFVVIVIVGLDDIYLIKFLITTLFLCFYSPVYCYNVFLCCYNVCLFYSCVFCSNNVWKDIYRIWNRNVYYNIRYIVRIFKIVKDYIKYICLLTDYIWMRFRFRAPFSMKIIINIFAFSVQYIKLSKILLNLKDWKTI